MTANTGLAAHSRFVARVRRRYADFMHTLPAGEPVGPGLRQAWQTLSGTLPTGDALRVLRQLVIERLVVLDCEQAASLAVVTQAVTELAELAIGVAVSQVSRELDALHGAPQNASGQRARLMVVGMGKFGARELNVSSDIDLIYIYDHDGQTAGVNDGKGGLSNHEYFGKAVRSINTLLSDSTEHGFVFRIDLALRPHGNSGPPAVSLAALEDYLQANGREWERFAWLKSRVITGSTGVGVGAGHSAGQRSASEAPGQALRAVVLPFVFRRYLDYSVFEALRVLHGQIRSHAAKRAAGRPARANDVKLSRGGIREIEFTVQLLQVVRGGQFPELRTRPTLDALTRLCKAGLMPAETAQAMASAYVFLRQVEHRIQYLDDQQTHVLPTDDADLDWLARSLGIASACEFLATLDTHRERVAAEFDSLLGLANESGCKTCASAASHTHGAPSGLVLADLDALLATLPPRFAQRVNLWRTHPRVLALQDGARTRLARLVQRTAVWLHEGRASEEAALRIADWIEPLLRRESYLALLLERPAVHERLLRVLGSARWPARYLLQHPGVIDELADDAMLAGRFDAEQFTGELHARSAALKAGGQDDEEALLNLLRRAHHAEVFRILARDVEGRISVEQVADDLSALADVVLAVTAHWCWERLKSRHIDAPQFAIIGYGKLGGKELGYGSDLDIVFVYDDAHEDAGSIYAAFVRKLINWLSVKTSEGDLFEIDTALRPNGGSGLLVSTFEAFANYQQQRGSNTAWTWEHQAMTRARFVLGASALRERFDAVRDGVITAPRDAAALRREIIAMRERVRAAHPVKARRDAALDPASDVFGAAAVATPEPFDVKHSAGGMVDVEFAVQCLVLSHSASHAELRENVGNIALLERAEAAGLLPAGVGHASAQAYRGLRRLQHHARLNEQPTQVAATSAATEQAAVLALWRAVFA